MIYTKTGDDGTTALYGEGRILKSDIQVEAYGSLDELSSWIGFLHSKNLEEKDKSLLTGIQKTLYLIMSNLAGKKEHDSFEKETIEIENHIDSYEKQSVPLSNFILPQGSELTSLFHITRTICRKAERNIVSYFHKNKNKENKTIGQYINRLSDLFFVLARHYGTGKEVIVNQ